MKRPTKRFLGLTWLGWVNFLIFQWLFVRLCLHMTQKDDRPGAFPIADHALGVMVGFGLVLGCLPFTGWSFTHLPCWPFKWAVPIWLWDRLVWCGIKHDGTKWVDGYWDLKSCV